MYKIRLISHDEIMEFMVYGLGRAIRKARTLIMIGPSENWEMKIWYMKG